METLKSSNPWATLSDKFNTSPLGSSLIDVSEEFVQLSFPWCSCDPDLWFIQPGLCSWWSILPGWFCWCFFLSSKSLWCSLVLAQMSSAVSPKLFFNSVFRLQLDKSSEIVSPFSFSEAARCSGVCPLLVLALISAPCSSRIDITWAWFHLAALCMGYQPSSVLAAMSALWFKRNWGRENDRVNIWIFSLWN